MCHFLVKRHHSLLYLSLSFLAAVGHQWNTCLTVDRLIQPLILFCMPIQVVSIFYSLVYVNQWWPPTALIFFLTRRKKFIIFFITHGKLSKINTCMHLKSLLSKCHSSGIFNSIRSEIEAYNGSVQWLGCVPQMPTRMVLCGESQSTIQPSVDDGSTEASIDDLVGTHCFGHREQTDSIHPSLDRHPPPLLVAALARRED